jgi:protein involved in polysaccharide export with SLBB domain
MMLSRHAGAAVAIPVPTDGGVRGDTVPPTGGPGGRRPPGRALACCAAALLLAACTTQSLSPVATEQPAGFAPWAEAAPGYRYGAGDKVKVQFLLTPEMNETALVAPDGSIALRTAGQLQAAGLTAAELERDVAAASRRVLRQPIVTVSLEEAGGSEVLVGGAVVRPGAVPLSRPRGVLEAVVLAGGFAPDARMTEVVLIRRNAANRPMLRTVDTNAFVATADAAQDVPVFPGDIVYVPRSRLGEVNLWIEQALNRVIPFNRSFSYAINRGNTVN